MLTASKKSTERIMRGDYRINYARGREYGHLTEYLEYLAMSEKNLSLVSLGKSASSRLIHAAVLGENPDKISAVYVGGMGDGDIFSPSVFLRFICDYCEYLREGKRAYGISMQYLAKNRTVCVIPMLNPDAYAEKNGVSVANSFPLKMKNAPDTPRECSLLLDYLTYCSDTLEFVLDTGADCGITYSSDGITPRRAKTVARLISRMSGYELREHTDSSNRECGTLSDAVIKRFGKSAYHCGYLEESTALSHDPDDYISIYASLREALFSCPVL